MADVKLIFVLTIFLEQNLTNTSL